jgi:hypothetical protein
MTAFEAHKKTESRIAALAVLFIFFAATSDSLAASPLTAFLDRSYYTSEPAASVVCCVSLPDGSLRGSKLEVRAADGAVLGRLAPARSECALAIPLKTLPLGANAMEAILRGRDGAILGKTPLQLIKREPKPGLEWKIDRQRRVVLDNGKPFFPFGVVMSGVKPDDAAAFKKLANHNFNTFLVWSKTTPEGFGEYQKNAAAHGLIVVSNPDECAGPITWDAHARYSGALLEKVKRVTDRGHSFIQLKNVLTLPIPVAERNAIYGEFYDKNIGRCIRGVETAREFRNLAAFYILDEPMEARYFDEYKFGQNYYARVHRADGYHPVMVNYSSFIPDGDEYVNWCEILATDPYWHPPAGADTRSTPNHVSKVAWLTNRHALAHRQAVWQILAGPRWSRCFKRPLSQREIRCQTYLALIHRATGIFYFSYSGARAEDWTTFKQLGVEMKVLAPFAVGPEVGQQITYRRALLEQPEAAPEFVENPFNPLKEQYPDVQAVLLLDPDGNLMLLAANSRHHPVTCRFEMPALAKVTPAFGGAPPPVRDGAFTDTLEPYATRAWRLGLKLPATPLPITLLQTVLKRDLPNPEPNLPGAWRPGRRNMMPNPSFEDATAEGTPDYCRLSAGATLHDRDALFGKRCVQLHKTASGGYEALHMHCDPQDSKPQTYTLSVWIKGSQNGLDAWLRSTHINPEKRYGENKNIKLTTSWQRYSIMGVIPARVSEALYEVRLREPGTLWVDGVQLERGEAPTEFEE